MTPTRLSVIIPVFNEQKSIAAILRKIMAVPVDKEIVLVDDGSTDGTRELILRDFPVSEKMKVIFHEKNQGKGRAIRTGIEASTGAAVIIQDADREYEPMDYLKLLDALDREGVNVIYGSRFLEKRKVTSFWHRAVNYFLTLCTNVLFSSRLTDMETCYKLMRSELVKNLSLESNGFEIEVELTAKILKKRERIVEVPISYKGRTFHEGKKIGWKDGFKAVWMLVHYRLQG